MAYLLLYSKYSPSCKRLLNLLRDNPVRDLEMLCIDNELVRTRISSGKMNINLVPCLLLFNINGVVEKFEGDVCFRWIEDVINKLYSSAKEEEEYIPPPSQKQKKKVKPIKQEEQEEDDAQEAQSEIPVVVFPEKLSEGREKVNAGNIMKMAEQFQKERDSISINRESIIPPDRPPVMLRKNQT